MLAVTDEQMKRLIERRIEQLSLKIASGEDLLGRTELFDDTFINRLERDVMSGELFDDANVAAIVFHKL